MKVTLARILDVHMVFQSVKESSCIALNYGPIGERKEGGTHKTVHGGIFD